MVNVHRKVVEITVAQKGTMATEVLCCLKDDEHIHNILTETLKTPVGVELSLFDVVDDFPMVILGGEWYINSLSLYQP